MIICAWQLESSMTQTVGAKLVVWTQARVAAGIKLTAVNPKRNRNGFHPVIDCWWLSPMACRIDLLVRLLTPVSSLLAQIPALARLLLCRRLDHGAQDLNARCGR